MKFEYDEKYFWQGEKVRLAAISEKDVEPKLAEYADSEARLYLEYETELPPVSLEAYREGLEPYFDFEDTSRMTMFSIQTLDGVPVGWLNLFKRDPRCGVFMVGLSIYRTYRQNGYGSEAMKIIMRYAFNELRYEKCNAECVVEDIASVEMHKALGFVEEGRRRKNVFFRGEFHDEFYFGLLRDEFNERWGK